MSSEPFKLWGWYDTLSGKRVQIVEVNNRPGYETVRGNDMLPGLGWRYNREADRGRCTGSPDNCPDNLVPHPRRNDDDLSGGVWRWEILGSLEPASHKLPPGLYRVFWRSGNSSLAAIGMNEDGSRWIAPTNWSRPATLYVPDILHVQRILSPRNH